MCVYIFKYFFLIAMRVHFVSLQLCTEMNASSFGNLFLVAFRGGRIGFNLIILGACRHSRYQTSALGPDTFACCVPQGSFTGSVAFVVYTNDIVETINHFALNNHLYADEQLLAPIRLESVVDNR